MIQYLAICIMGADEPGLAHQLSSIIAEHHCQIELSSMNKMGTQFMMNCLVSGNRNSIIKLEETLQNLPEEFEIDVLTKQVGEETDEGNAIPYIIQVIAAYEPNLLSKVTAFFSEQEMNIREITAARYIAQQTGAEMFNLQILIDLPTETNIASFRADFQSFCEDNNLDASMEPDKL